MRNFAISENGRLIELPWLQEDDPHTEIRHEAPSTAATGTLFSQRL